MSTTATRRSHVAKPKQSKGLHLRVLERLQGMWAKRSPDPVKEHQRMRKEWR